MVRLCTRQGACGQDVLGVYHIVILEIEQGSRYFKRVSLDFPPANGGFGARKMPFKILKHLMVNDILNRQALFVTVRRFIDFTPGQAPSKLISDVTVLVNGSHVLMMGENVDVMSIFLKLFF